MITWSHSAARTMQKCSFFSDNLLREQKNPPASYSNFRKKKKLFESGYKQITGNDGSAERGSQLTVINAIKVLAGKIAIMIAV